MLPSGVPRKIVDLSGCLAENFQKLFSACLDGLGNRLKAGLFDGSDFPQGLAVCVQSKPALLGGSQMREGFSDTRGLFCRIILYGIFVASTVLLALVVDGVIGVAMVAMTPLITIQLLGLYYKFKTARALKADQADELRESDEDVIIVFEEEKE